MNRPKAKRKKAIVLRYTGSIKYTEEEIIASFWLKVLVKTPSECWEWIASKDGCGYGCFRGNHAHRFSIQIHLNRRLKPGECVLHTCDNPACINPVHLFIGDQKINARDKEAKGRGNHAFGVR